MAEVQTDRLVCWAVCLEEERRVDAPGPIGWRPCSSRRWLSEFSVPREPSVAGELRRCRGSTTQTKTQRAAQNSAQDEWCRDDDGGVGNVGLVSVTFSETGVCHQCNTLSDLVTINYEPHSCYNMAQTFFNAQKNQYTKRTFTFQTDHFCILHISPFGLIDHTPVYHVRAI